MEYWSRIFVPNISAEYFRRNAIKKKEKVVNLVHLLHYDYSSYTGPK